MLGARGQAVVAVVASGKKTATPTATKGATTTMLASTTNSGDVDIYYPGRKRPALLAQPHRVRQHQQNHEPAAGVVIRAIAEKIEDGFYRSDELKHICV